MASSSTWPLVVLCLLLAMPTSAVGEAATIESAPSTSGALLDVRVLSSECLQAATCEPTKPSHLVEYFSADWCEPCLSVSSQLANLSADHVLLQHHASPADETFLSDSKLRFDQTFRMVFIPSLVIDGTHLLTGTRQALDLESVLENNTPEWSGLESLAYSDGLLTWQESTQGHVRVWMATPTPHTMADSVHSNLARASLATNASSGQLNLSNLNIDTDSFLVVVLEQEGTVELTAASLAPTGLIDISSGGDEATSTTEPRLSEGVIVVAITGVLMFLLMPAMVMHRRLMHPFRTQSHAENLEEE
jgi:thiol-disulfide isomerase/thioredoxin